MSQGGGQWSKPGSRGGGRGSHRGGQAGDRGRGGGGRGGNQGGERGRGSRGGYQGGDRGGSGGYQGGDGGPRGGYQGGSRDGGRGGHQGDGSRGGGRGPYHGGGRGGFAPRGVKHEVIFVPASSVPDTYAPNQPIPKPAFGWKDFPETKDEVVLHKYGGSVGTWAKENINVSVNHFAVQSKKGPNAFAFSDIYHYDISYEIIRNQSQAPAPSQSGTNVPGKGKGKKKGGKGKQTGAVAGPSTSDDLTVPLEELDIESKKKGEKPANKKLPKHLTKIILDHLMEKIRKEYNHYGMGTDLSFNLFSTQKFHEAGSKIKIPMQHIVTFADLRAENRIDEDRDESIRVMFEPSIDNKTGGIHTINTRDITQYFQQNGTLKGFDLSPELKQTLEAACNAFVKSFPPPDFRYFAIGRSTMVKCGLDAVPGATKALGGGIAAWRGLSANIAMGWKPFLNVDLANCAFLLNENVLTVIDQVLNKGKWDRDVKTPANNVKMWKRQEHDDVKSILNTCKVSYKVQGRKFTGPIVDLGRKSVSESTFRWEEKGKDISVFNYYKERYNTQLQYPEGPVVMIRKKSTMVPAELCNIKEGQSYNRKLDGNQTTEMLRFSKKDPGELKADIENQIKSFNLENNAVLKGLDIKMDTKMHSMDARVLVPPTLRYGENQKGEVALVQPNDGTWEVWNDNYKFYNPALEVKKWGVLVAGCWKIKKNDDPQLWGFLKLLMKHGQKKGVKFSSDPDPVILVRVQEYGPQEQNRQEFEKQFKTNFKGCQLVLCVLPSKTSILYNAVKHAAEIDVGILTQCVAQDNIMSPRAKDSLVQNILLKINSKLGGINHVTVAPAFDAEKAKMFCKLIMFCPTLVMGADVTHAPPGSKKTVQIKGKDTEFTMPSYAAVTGSLDKTCMPFMTEVRAQRKLGAGAAEVIQDLQKIAFNMLSAFYEKSQRKVFPQKIIYYRDGVGEGQFPEVLHVEMRAMRRACEDFGKKYNVPNYEPKITFITVQKRHQTRIFWNCKDGVVANAPAGTVIDKDIVHPTEIDFYLLSHKGMLGTSRPSRYHVLWDDTNFTLDQIQSLTYTLCYMFVRCTKSVKMPAPTYYAHLAAERAKKLCDGFESKNNQEPSDEYLNQMLERAAMQRNYPMHFV